jgi:peptidoglycan L-alanyl-D-glutamate endopeptidase CwlK
MPYTLPPSSIAKMTGLHPDLVKVARAAAQGCTVPFIIVEGRRSRERQFQLWRQSHEMDGSDIPGAKWATDRNGSPRGQLTPEGAQGTGIGNHQDGLALDFAAMSGGQIDWTDFRLYEKVADAFLQAGGSLNISVIWGGSFPKRDMDHIELNRAFYRQPYIPVAG